MKRHVYELDDTVWKTTHNVQLWACERGILELSENALAVRIKGEDDSCGFVFCGTAKFVLDSIVETERGAIGRPVEKEVTTPFVMIGENNDLTASLAKTEEEGFRSLQFTDEQAYLAKAETLLNQLLGNSSHINCTRTHGANAGLIFAFSNEQNRFDFLVVKGSKIVYKAIGKVFVAKGDKIVLKSPGEVVVSRPNKSVFIKKGRHKHINIYENTPESPQEF